MSLGKTSFRNYASKLQLQNFNFKFSTNDYTRVFIEPFLSEGYLLQEERKTRYHSCYFLCVAKVIGACDSTTIEKLLMVNFGDFSDHRSPDTKSYSYEEVDDNMDDLLSDCDTI